MRNWVVLRVSATLQCKEIEHLKKNWQIFSKNLRLSFSTYTLSGFLCLRSFNLEFTSMKIEDKSRGRRKSNKRASGWNLSFFNSWLSIVTTNEKSPHFLIVELVNKTCLHSISVLVFCFFFSSIFFFYACGGKEKQIYFEYNPGPLNRYIVRSTAIEDLGEIFNPREGRID